MARALLIVLVLFAAALSPTAPARAAAEWCDTDPLLVIRTPGGALVTVYLLVGARGVEHLPAAQVASILVTGVQVDATSGGRATRVAVTVTVPNDLFGTGFGTRAVASSGLFGTGTLYDATEGTSGAGMDLRFTLPVP